MKASEFPLEIQELLLTRQQEAGNDRDLSIFDDNLYADTSDGGFGWSVTPEKYKFWDQLLVHKNIDVYYQIYGDPEYKITLEKRNKKIKDLIGI